MSLFRKIFGAAESAPTQFHDSEAEADADKPASDNAPRRELVHFALREVMQKHAIPRDWIDCRMLSVQTANHKPAIHVQFIVLDGEEQLMDYVHAFQDSFWGEIEARDGKVREWLLSVAWQFEGKAKRGLADMRKPLGASDEPRKDPQRDPLDQDTQPQAGSDDDIEADLRKLFAIRDAALDAPADETPPPFSPTVPGKPPL